MWWDTGWLTRHYFCGSFEKWNKVLDELFERGYNAIRIECFPHWVAAGNDGIRQKYFLRDRGNGVDRYPYDHITNFTQPQFQGVWNDIAWHREVTLIICGERSW